VVKSMKTTGTGLLDPKVVRGEGSGRWRPVPKRKRPGVPGAPFVCTGQKLRDGS